MPTPFSLTLYWRMCDKLEDTHAASKKLKVPNVSSSLSDALLHFLKYIFIMLEAGIFATIPEMGLWLILKVDK